MPHFFIIRPSNVFQIGQAQRLGRYGQVWKQELNPTNNSTPALSDGQKLWCTVCLLDDRLGLVVTPRLDYQSGARDDELVSLKTTDSEPRETALHAHVCIVNIMRKLTSGILANIILIFPNLTGFSFITVRD
jgi:hypothetical protein